jgi:hypothetical protein
MGFLDSFFGPRDAAAYNSRGGERQQKGDMNGAIADFGKAIRLDPCFMPAYLNRGFARYAIGEFNPAIEDLSKAIELDPTGLAYNDRGLARLAIGDTEGAIADFDKAIEFGERASYFGRGLARLKQDDAEAAVADFRTAVMLDPRCIAHLRQLYPRLDPDLQHRVAELIENSEPAAGSLGATSTTDQVANLPPPPPGFTWHSFKEARMAVLRPAGWRVHQVDAKNFTGCVSKESIQAQGSFTTGLTLNALRGVKECLRQHNPDYHPDVPIMGVLESLYPDLLSDPGFQVLYLDQGVQRTPNSRLFRFQHRQLAPARPDIPWHGPIICQKFIIEFDQSEEVYDFTFESPESSWEGDWPTGKQILTNLVFCGGPGAPLLFSIDPPLPPEELLQARALEVGRTMGWDLALEDRVEGLFIWRINLVVAPAEAPGASYSGTFAWYMKRNGNEIWLDDPVNLLAVDGASEALLEELNAGARKVQEEFKRRWLALVGPVTLRGASPETHSAELLIRAAMKVAQESGALPQPGAAPDRPSD